MNCNKTTTATCDKKSYAQCVNYEGELSDNTKITDDCYSVQEVIEDLGVVLDETIDKLDVSGLTGACITFTAPRTLQTVLQDMLTKICSLQTQLTTAQTTIATHTTQITDLQNNNCP